MLKISPLYDLKKKFEFSTLRKYCVFPIRMAIAKCSSCSIFFVLNRFFPPLLGSVFRCYKNYGFLHTKWQPPTQNPRDSLVFMILSRERTACVIIHMVDLHDLYDRFFCKWAFGLDEIATFPSCFLHVTRIFFARNIKMSISLGSGAHFQAPVRY